MKANLNVRFADALQMWNQAIDNGGATFYFPDQNATIHANFRLQRYRKAVRDNLLPNEVSTLDMWVVKVPPNGCSITIEMRPLIKPTRIERLDGTAITDLALGEDE